MTQRSDLPGCLLAPIRTAVAVALIVLGVALAAGACGGADQAGAHATLTALCLAEEHRAVSESEDRETAEDRVGILRSHCDALLQDVAYNPATCHECGCAPGGCGP